MNKVKTFNQIPNLIISGDIAPVLFQEISKMFTCFLETRLIKYYVHHVLYIVNIIMNESSNPTNVQGGGFLHKRMSSKSLIRFFTLCDLGWKDYWIRQFCFISKQILNQIHCFQSTRVTVAISARCFSTKFWKFAKKIPHGIFSVSIYTENKCNLNQFLIIMKKHSV